MNFLQFAVWGAYLTSMGNYLGNAGLGANIGVFYSIQGVVSIFMPALMGIVADRWIPAQKLLGNDGVGIYYAPLTTAYDEYTLPTKKQKNKEVEYHGKRIIRIFIRL